MQLTSDLDSDQAPSISPPQFTYVSDDVYLGEDGYHFLAAGSNNVKEFLTSSDAQLADYAARWAQLLLNRAAKVRDLGSEYCHIFAPEKLSVLPEKAGPLAENLHSFCGYIEDNLAQYGLEDIVVPTLSVLRDESMVDIAFPRTDSHWTSRGCFSILEKICDRFDLTIDRDLFEASLRQMRYAGDLSSKTAEQTLEIFSRSIMPVRATRVWANDLVKFNEENPSRPAHAGCIVQYENADASNDASVLLFGDSYSEYRAGFLTGMLADAVRKLTFVWSPSIDWSLIAEVQPDIVISEISERFSRNVPIDGADVRAESQTRADALAA